MEPVAHGALRGVSGAGETPVPDDVSPAVSGELHGILLLDCRGVVRFCNHDGRRLLGGGCADLLGHPVAELLPELRLKAATPGYNLAYALFRFPNEGWYPARATSGQGKSVSLEVSVSVLRVENRHQLLLALRTRPAGPA
jgi:hypothetical protein